MNDLSLSTQFSIPPHRSIEIRETVKQNLNNIMKNIEEYSSLSVLCKEVSIEYCNNKIGMSYMDSSSSNFSSKSVLYLQHQSEKLYGKYLECCNSFKLLKEQYKSLAIKIKDEIDTYKSFLIYIQNEGFEKEIENWFVFSKILTLSSIKEKLENIENMVDYDFTIKMSILDSFFTESNPDTLSIYISVFVSSPGFDEVFINNFKTILDNEFK